MKRLIPIILITLVAACSQAPAPVSKPDPSCPGFQTLNEAAIAALHKSVAISTSEEYAGVLFKQGNLYCFTQPTSNGSDADFRIEAELPAQAQLTGIYHTHPDFPDSQLYSPNDVETAKRMDVVSFLGDIKDDSVLSFDPDHDATPAGDRIASLNRYGKVPIARQVQ